jgi:hypothetical protein
MPANAAAAKGGGRGGHDRNSMSFRRQPKRSPSPDDREGEDEIIELAPPPLAPLSEITLADGRKVEEVASDLLKLDRGDAFLIDPRRSKFIMFWDVVTTSALVFTATVTPVEVALLNPDVNALFFINRLVDIIFLLDIVLTFFTMYEVVSQSINKQGMWVKFRKKIARHYLLGWFALDTFSVGVSFVDIYSVLQKADGPGSGGKAGSLSALKTLRILRLFKLIRLSRISRIVARWETRVAVDYAMVEIIKCILKVVCCSHWMACVWCLQAHMNTGGPLGDLTSAEPVTTWLGVLGYCKEDLSDPMGYVCDNWSDIYTAAIYYSVMTITSIGYGDISASAKNSVEMWVAVSLMMVSSLIWASVIGTYCGVVATLNPDRAAFHEMIQELNRFMAREDLEAGLQFRLREYFHRSRHLRMANAQQRLLGQMPPSLRGEVAWATCQTWLASIYFLKGAPREFMVELALCLQAMVYAPDDQPEHDYLYIVHAGIALYQARVVTKGQCFGEDIILVSPHLRGKARARAIDYLEVFYVGRSELLHVAARYPVVARSIRRAAILIALRREMILIAKRQVGIKETEKISMFKLMNQAQIAKDAKRENWSMVDHYCGSDVRILAAAAGGAKAKAKGGGGGSGGGGGGSGSSSSAAAAAKDDASPAVSRNDSPNSAAVRKPSEGFMGGASSASTASAAPASAKPSFFPDMFAEVARGSSAPPPTPTDAAALLAAAAAPRSGMDGGMSAQLQSFANTLQAQHRMEVAALKADLKAELSGVHALVLESNQRLVELLSAAGGAPAAAGTVKRTVVSKLAARKLRPQKV